LVPITPTCAFKEALPKDVVELQRKLTVANTRMQTFRFHEARLSERLAELQNTSPNVTSADLPILIKVFHPDAEHDASPTRKKQLTAGMQIINRIKEGPGAGEAAEEEEVISLARQRAARRRRSK
jgi:molybdopterin-biosynthesis enzyme MoeA-like protein